MYKRYKVVSIILAVFILTAAISSSVLNKGLLCNSRCGNDVGGIVLLNPDNESYNGNDNFSDNFKSQ